MSKPTRPETKQQAIIWNRYNWGKWDWFNISEWPTDLSKAVITENLTYSTRFRLFLYFVGNGMEPNEARDKIKSMLKKQPDRDHIDYLYKDLKKNRNKWTYWDERMGKTTTLGDTEIFSEVNWKPVRQRRPVEHNRVIVVPKKEEIVWKPNPKRRSKQDELLDDLTDYEDE